MGDAKAAEEQLRSLLEKAAMAANAAEDLRAAREEAESWLGRVRMFDVVGGGGARFLCWAGGGRDGGGEESVACAARGVAEAKSRWARWGARPSGWSSGCARSGAQL